MLERAGLRRRIEEIVEVLMLRPGSPAAARLLVRVRWLFLACNVAILLLLSLVWRCSTTFVVSMLALDGVVLLVTVLLELALRTLSPRALRGALLASFVTDIAVEIVGLMSSGLSHSTIVVVPLLSAMTAGLFLSIRASALCACCFAIGYPAGALLVQLRLWPLTTEVSWSGLDGSSQGSLVLFAVMQILYFSLVLPPYLLMVSKLRGLYSDFSARLAAAVARIEGEAEERRKLEEKMRQAQKLESLGLLAGGVAHDFNNLLLGIMGNAEVTALELPEGSPQRTALARIVDGSQRAAKLCQQMLTYAGRCPATLVALDLNQLIRELPDLLGAAIPKGARLRYELAPDLPLVEGDAGQLRQLVMNLLINAGEALGEDGGEVRVSTGVTTFEEPALDPAVARLQWASDRPQGPYVFFKVADDGCGMDQGTLEKIFDPFFSTKFAGRGLGLSAVIGIVSEHRGLIRVESRRGAGTEVTVGLPHRPVASRAARRVARESWRGRGLVLLIDDERSVREVIALMLRRMGFEVLEAAGGEEGIALLRRAGALALIICDLAMPEQGGEAVARAAHAERPGLPVLLTSGCSRSEMERRLAGLEGQRCLAKPFSYGELQEAVRGLVEGRGDAGDQGRAS